MFCLLDDQGVIHKPYPKAGRVEGWLEGFDFKLFHEKVGYEGTNGGTHGCTMDLFIVLTLEEEVGVFEAEL